MITQLDDWGFNPLVGGATMVWMQWTAVALLLTIPLAAASWYLVERPALSLRDRLTRRLRKRDSEAPAPVTPEERETDIAAP